MGDTGLSQDDFRKLLQTPRAPPTESETPRFKAPAPKAPRNAGAVFATPHSLRKKRPRQQQQQKEQPSATPSNYRDRAAERRNNEQQEETTEDLLQNTTREEDETLDPKQVYEQSKYLGGDVDHTHLVKGLDYSLLEKVRSDLTAKLADAKGEAALDDALDNIGAEEGDDEEQEEQEEVSVHSLLAKNLVHLFNNKPQSNELFAPGRMAFVFELADEVGHYADAFALPTTVIRSKADVMRRRTDRQAETELVISKISQIMRPVVKQPEPVVVKPAQRQPEHPPPAIIDSDDDIFSDAEDYSLDEEALEKNRAAQPQVPVRNYFGDEDKQEEEEEDDSQMKEVSELLSQATKNEPEQPTKRRKYEQEEDADAMDIDMFGLSTSALPTSFEERQRTVAYDPDDEDGAEGTTSLVDQGTHRNKKAQLTRWDFDDEEQWQKYKDSVEIHPKSAFQFGVKLGDGRKRNREQRKGMSDKQKLNRDYQMVKNVMDKKYGKK
ncbi:RED-like protein N-terminal region-domain-containing protein [Fennellomyces sp. T-0311]|nr:RED-like protein N-terminal region-domain-containing protein [Fennellomyces sp. T-0311]